MVPAVVTPLAAFPLNPSGKVDSAQLPDPFAAAAGVEAGGEGGGGEGAAAGGYVAPEGELEALLQRVWTECLRLKAPLGVTADFFAAGGSSLLVRRGVAGRRGKLMLCRILDAGLPCPAL